MARNREHVKERVAGGVERFEFAVRVATACPQLGHRSGSADRRDVVADGAARAVERRPQAFLARFNFEKIVEPEAELLELDRRDAGKRGAQRAARLCRQHRGQSEPAAAIRPRGEDDFHQCPLLGDQRAAHERMAGAAQLRAFEHVLPGCGGTNVTVATPLPRLGIVTLISVPTMRKP